MHYCRPCNRYFETAQAIRQHLQDSDRHAYDLLPARRSAAPVRLPVQTTTLSSAMPLFGAQSGEEEPSKSLIKGYNLLLLSFIYSWNLQVLTIVPG